jgi:hypothetical protein
MTPMSHKKIGIVDPNNDDYANATADIINWTLGVNGAMSAIFHIPLN